MRHSNLPEFLNRRSVRLMGHPLSHLSHPNRLAVTNTRLSSMFRPAYAPHENLWHRQQTNQVNAPVNLFDFFLFDFPKTILINFKGTSSPSYDANDTRCYGCWSS